MWGRILLKHFQRGYKPGDKFPAKELTALFFPQFASAVTIASLFPYVGFMMVTLKMSPTIEAAGYYAGFVASSVMLGRIVSSMFWGKFSDVYGRKPVVCICCLAVATSALCFGCSTNFTMAVSSRLLLGLFNPIVGTARTSVSEICGKKYEATGMGSISGAWFLGLTVGPIVGSILARPCDLYPKTFESFSLLKRYPYLLPNIVCSALALFSLMVVLAWFPETLPESEASDLGSREKGKEEEMQPDEEVGAGDSVEKEGLEMTSEAIAVMAASEIDASADADDATSLMMETDKTRRAQDKDIGTIGGGGDGGNGGGGKGSVNACTVIGTRGVPSIIVAYGLLAALAMTFDEVFPLWAMSSPTVGGLRFDIRMVGSVISVTGIMLIFYNLLIYPATANYLGPRRSFIVGQLLFSPLILVTCVAGEVCAGEYCSYAFVTVCTALMKMTNSLSLCGISIIINQLVEAQHRGSLNGIVITVDSVVKMIGLAYGPVLYAWSIARHRPFPLDFHFAFLVMSVLSCFSCAAFACAPGSRSAASSTIELTGIVGQTDFPGGEGTQLKGAGVRVGSEVMRGEGENLVTVQEAQEVQEGRGAAEAAVAGPGGYAKVDTDEC